MSQAFRLPQGGLIDRGRRLGFVFNGQRYQGYEGDSLAAALLANGVRLVGRSFKYHRPRGIFALGAEEPNALVQLGLGARTEPNSRATQVELQDGLVAGCQNCWPSVDFDLGATLGLFSRLLPSGFYYKTFKWPPGRWIAFEPFIRRMAGLGVCATAPDPDRYDHSHLHCEVLVVGGGPAGLAAAVAAGRQGLRVLLVDDNSRLGGSLLHDRVTINGVSGADWVQQRAAELADMPEVTVLTRATAFGYYDHNQLGVVERVADHRPARPGEPRQRLWHVHAERVVLATGAHERPLVFANNDLPGVMLAGAVRGYVNRYAVRPGSAAVVLTNNDSAYATATDLVDAGVGVAAIVDLRPDPPAAIAAPLRDRGVAIHLGSTVVAARGRRRVQGVEIAPVDAQGRPGSPTRRIACDLLCVSGGWTPAVHLHAQARGRPVFDASLGAFVPGASVQREQSVGAARGVFDLAGCIADGAGAGAGQDLALMRTAGDPPRDAAPVPGDRRKRFVDLQNDVTDADIALAVREGYRSVEHVKRYTTLGMGTDQGKTSNIHGFARIAEALGTTMEGVGTTTFRPPYVPVTIGALAGAECGRHFHPNRRTPMHKNHIAAGAVMLQAGQWLRPQCYPRPDEDIDTAARREARGVRNGVGIVDVSTLGKFELIGPDAVTFLERVYVNRWSTLKPGRCRYGLMLREDGIVFDDGTTTCIADRHYFMTTTTAQTPLLARRLDYYHRVYWPDLDLRIVNVTDQWAAIALAGPHSRAVLERLIGATGVDNATLPHMGFRATTLDGVPLRIHRISFSGDLAYEIYAPAAYGASLWDRLTTVGAVDGIAPYGIDALNALRIEKGHVAGGELDGRVTADDLGLGRMVRADGDFVGRRGMARPGLSDAARWQLVGIAPTDGRTALPPGAKIVDDQPDHYLGEMTSATWSPTLQQPIGLALVAGGRARYGQQLLATSPLADRHVPVIVQSPVFFDPEGRRIHA